MSTGSPQGTAIEPLRFEDGALLVLDQRALPEAERWIRCETVEQVADCIRTLAVRGAPAIGLAAAYGMALADGREDAAELLRSTRPTAVNLAWALEQCRDAPDALEVARRLHHEQDEADRRLAGLGAELFEEGTRALTHCNTGALATGGYGTAFGVLRAAWERGRLAEVWVDETRPLLQGARLTAWELRQAGIPHRVVADSAAGSLMARGLVDRVVVGADRIAANGDVANKVGTYPLAVLAARHGVPFYVAAPLSTIDPATPDGGAIPIEERDPAEVLEGGDAFNPAFDVTPAELVTAILTDAGVLEAPYAESIARAVGGVMADDLRSAVVEAAREMLRLGLVSGSSGNVSARDGDEVLITPAGLPYERMTEDDLVTIGMDGEAAEGQREPSSERRVHLAIYAARPDVAAVVHTHSVHATAWSFTGEPLDTGTEELEAAAGGEVLTARFAATGSDEIAAAVLEALGDRRAVLLARHGVVAVGKTPAAALDTCVALERQAQIAWLLRG